MSVYKKMFVKDIKPYANNPRAISAEAVESLARSIKTYGYISPICVDQDGVVLAGHTTLRAAKNAGLTEVDVIQVELSEVQAMGYRIADNKTAELARWDHGLLVDEARDLMNDAPDLVGEMGLADWELSRLYADIERAVDDAPKPKAERKPTAPRPAQVGGVKLIQRCVLYVDKPADLPRFLELLGVDSVAKIPITIRAARIFGGI